MKTNSTLLAGLLASAALFAGCERGENRAQNERRDSVVAASDSTARNDVREAGRDAAATTGKAVDAVADKARDAAISIEINALLARDSDLSALGIDVDTAGGHVVLRGSAPDATARERATRLARGVDGVVDVNNELQLRPRN